MTALAGAAGLLGTRLPLPRGGRWERTNHRGETVSLTGGLAAAAGALVGAAFAPAPIRGAALVAGCAGAAAGFIDDHGESRLPTAKGLQGHLGLLARGRVSTGVLKIAIIGAGAGVSSVLLTRDPVDVAVRAVGIAATANLINLLDLRPGRAHKATAFGSALLAPGSSELAAALLGAVAGTVRDDLARRTMLGDLGANALGAVLGAALASHPSRLVRTVGAGAAVGLVLASERVSFSRIIDNTPALAAIDNWGR